MISGGNSTIKIGGKDVALNLRHRADIRTIARIAYQYMVGCGTSQRTKGAVCGSTHAKRMQQIRIIARKSYMKQGYAFRLKFRTLIARERSIKALFKNARLRFSSGNIRALFNGCFKIVAKRLPPPRRTGGGTYTVTGRRPSVHGPSAGNARMVSVKRITLKRVERRAVKRALKAAARKVYRSGSLNRFKEVNWDRVDTRVKAEFIKGLIRYGRSLRKKLKIGSRDAMNLKNAIASVLYVSYFPGVAFLSVAQPSMPRSPTLTRGLFINIGTALKKTLKAQRTLRGYTSIRTLVLAIKGKKLRWRNKLNHPTHLKFLFYLNKVMASATRPKSKRMFPVKWSNSQSNQRIYASWLLYRYVNHLTRKPPKLNQQLLKKVGAALERTRQQYRRTLGHDALVPLTCSLRQQLNVKWRWHKLSSRVHKYLVKSLERTMPKALRPKEMYPVSVGFKRAYARWLLIQYVRHTKLKAPPASKLTLSDKQRRLYLKYAVLPAVRKAGSVITKPVHARRHLIWAKYKNVKMLPPGLSIKLSRFTTELLKRGEFSKIRQQIAAGKRKYCPSGEENITTKMYRDAIWNALAVADAKSARQRAKPARVEAVSLTTQQKRVVLAAVFKAVNKHLLQLGKKRFRNAAHAKLYLRKNAWIWNRLGSSLNNKLILGLGPLLSRAKIGNLYTLLVLIGRASPMMLYHSAVFDTNAGYITVVKRRLRPAVSPPARRVVALKPLTLTLQERIAAKGKLLRAWRTLRTRYTLRNFNTSSELAAYLKTNDKNLTAGQKGWLMYAFKNALNSRSNPVPRSIQPMVKSRLKQKQNEFTQRVYIALVKVTKVASTPPRRPPTRPVTPTPPQPRPADPQLALQQVLVAAVRKVYGASTSESSAKTVLKTQKWSTLKQLGIVRHIQGAFRELGYRKAARSSSLAQRVVKKTLRDWKTSSGTTTPARPTPPPRRVPPRRPTPPQPRPADTQLALQRALISAVRRVYGASTSESSVKTVLKTQKWQTLKQLGITAHIMKSFGRLGYRSAARNSRVAQKLVQKTLEHWGTSSDTTTRTPTRPVTPAPAPARPRPSDDQLKLQQALVAAVRKVYGASTSESSAKTVLKTQKWETLKQLGIASDIQKAFGRLGYAKAAKSSRAARRLLRETLRKWK